jgi:hypothetical protein
MCFGTVPGWVVGRAGLAGPVSSVGLVNREVRAGLVGPIDLDWSKEHRVSVRGGVDSVAVARSCGGTCVSSGRIGRNYARMRVSSDRTVRNCAMMCVCSGRIVARSATTR